ncbi:hypothetical protein HD554DRAFT_2036417 [Boletus coccyginus]|nr:hypothetical protein HD554DRAFT_2036417 [Boletus coccyginus]
MCALSTHHKDTIKQMPPIHKDDTVKEQDCWEEEGSSLGPTPCTAGHYQKYSGVVLLKNKTTEGRKALSWIQHHQNVNISEVGLTLDELCTQHKELMVNMDVVDSSVKERAKQMRNTLGLLDIDMVLGQYKDHIHALDTEEQK